MLGRTQGMKIQSGHELKYHRIYVSYHCRVWLRDKNQLDFSHSKSYANYICSRESTLSRLLYDRSRAMNGSRVAEQRTGCLRACAL